MTTQVAELAKILASEKEAPEGFVDILEKEAEVLSLGVNASPEALADITQTKWLRANALNELVTQRQAVLSTLDQQKVGAVVSMDAAAAAHPELQAAWNQIKTIFQRARELNDSNGVMIDSLKRFTEDAMTTLRAASGQEEVYSSDGKTRVSKPRVLGAG